MHPIPNQNTTFSLPPITPGATFATPRQESPKTPPAMDTPAAYEAAMRRLLKHAPAPERVPLKMTRPNHISPAYALCLYNAYAECRRPVFRESLRSVVVRRVEDRLSKGSVRKVNAGFLESGDRTVGWLRGTAVEEVKKPLEKKAKCEKGDLKKHGGSRGLSSQSTNVASQLHLERAREDVMVQLARKERCEGCASCESKASRLEKLQKVLSRQEAEAKRLREQEEREQARREHKERKERWEGDLEERRRVETERERKRMDEERQKGQVRSAWRLIRCLGGGGSAGYGRGFRA
ncbi:hypothetical protein BU26DRAFT_321398 [Trematosphaeria pertusa]|uniref:Uncharacterized protein n=1 Tax=Trematosphaeria pertusa TaxID=390896 RepID=A0A6A6IC57_9PLEO|nr:uncharacterized protein BU26DRAFT_321398 [Trematosphaeria pertusa]KAF2247829.1 hypothetical protein BU26DRAFT_321398 [Trematosphaeria pertusa]